MKVRALLLRSVAFGLGLAVACSSDKKAKEKDDGLDEQPEASVEAGPPSYAPCTDEQPLLGPDGNPTGFMTCADNAATGLFSYHRAEIVTCGSLVPRASRCGSPDGAAPDACHYDSECVDRPNGFCTTSSRSAYCYCDYGCTVDSDCLQGYICQCSGPVGKCVKQTCTQDSACAAGAQCRSGIDVSCNPIFACQTAEDTCSKHDDCAQFPGTGCLVVDGHRKCDALPVCR